MDEMTEKEMKSIKMSTLYELRLLFTQGEENSAAGIVDVIADDVVDASQFSLQYCRQLFCCTD